LKLSLMNENNPMKTIRELEMLPVLS